MERCGLNNLFSINPKLRIAPNINSIKRSLTSFNPTSDTTITIPIVFHVIYGTNKSWTNISNQKIIDNVAQLNLDFSGKNSDVVNLPCVFKDFLSSGSGIKFTIHEIRRVADPQNRKFNSKTAPYFTDEWVKYGSDGGSNPITSVTGGKRPLNVWICDLDLLGYATLPYFQQYAAGYPSNVSLSDPYVRNDGVVINCISVGSVSNPTSDPDPSGTSGYRFGLGRTLTHEVGHWCGLMHLWNDCDISFCCSFPYDLPTQNGPTTGKPNHPNTINACPSTIEQYGGNMFMNYMDYADDDHMYMFSKSQIELMREEISLWRTGNSPGISYMDCVSNVASPLEKSNIPVCQPSPPPTPTPGFVGKISANISLPTTSSYSIYLDLDETRDVLYVGTRSAIVNNTGVGGIHAISCVNDQVLRTTSFNGQGLWDTGIAVNPITQKVYGMGWPITNGVFNASTNRNLLVVNSLNGSNINSVVVGPYGRDIAINRSLNRIYVINNSKVGVFNGTNDSKISDISFGETSIISIAINENTSKGYVTTYTGNILYVFDTNTLRIIKTIQIGSGGQTRLFNLRGVAIDKIKNKIYVVNTLNYLGPGDQLPWRSSVSVIDGTTDTLSSTIEIPLATDRREVFNGIDVNPITNRLYVSGLYYGTIKVINTLTNTIEGSLEVGDGLYDICVNSNLNKVYASKYSGGIVVVDTKQEIKPTATPPGFTSQPTPTPTKTPAPTPAPTEPIYRVIKEIPLSGSVPYVDLDRNTGILYAGVAHSGFGEVAAINCNNDVGEVLRNTRFENVISGLTLNQTTNKIYVTTSGNNLVVIKGSTGETLRTLSTGQSPGNVGVENIIQGSPVVYTYPRIYVPSTASQYISVLEDRESSGGFETEITRIPRTVRPVNVEINEKLGKGYITDLYSDQLMIFNTSNPSLNSIINIKSNSIFPTFFTRKIAINRINNLVYVVNNSALSVSVVDGITNQILFEINLATPGVTGARLSGMAISPNTNKLFVSERKSNSIYIIDTITNTKIGSVVVGGSPYDLVLRPGVGRMYVGHSSGVSVVSIDSPFVPTPTPTNTPTPTVTPALENLGRGRTRIYSWNGSSWIKMNPNIVGNEGGDQSGHSVSISKNGEFVAIGAPYNRSLSSPSRVGQVRVYQSLCETIPTPTPTASSQLTWGPLVDQTAEWELPAEDLFWNFRNLYNFRVVKMELPGTTFTYPYRAWFFGYSVADFNPDLVSPQIDDSPYVNDAIFYARSTGLKSGWQVYCGKDANGNNVWDTTMNPALWKPVVYRSAYQNTLSYDSEVAGDPAVVYYQGTFYMAYSASGRKIVGNDTYFIACIMGATSTNGIDWVKSSAPILEWPLERTISLPAVRPGYWTPANYYGAYHRPSLMLDEGKWKMWFDYFTPDATKWLCLGYAENTVITDFLNGNLTTPAAGQTKWQVLYADTNWLMENWPNPSVVKIGNTYYAFCDASNRSDPGSAANPGTHLGGDGRITVVAQSPDGINWTKTGFILPDGLDCANVGEAFVHTENGQVWLYLFYAWKPRTTQNPKPVDWYQYKKVKYTRKLIGPNSTPTPTATIPGFTQPPTPTPTPSRTPGPTRTPTPTPTPIPILKNYSRSTTDDVNHTNWGLLRMILDSNLTDWGEP